MTDVVRVGTRSSRLALAQTESVIAMLKATVADVLIEIVTIRTEGDRNQTSSIPGWGTGVFVHEIESALLSGDIDIAVHSMKDVPPAIPDGLALVAMPQRADSRDVLLSRSGAEFNDLTVSACIGTSSQRRAAFLRAARPDLRFAPIRGNVDTRIAKLFDPAAEYDAIVLAAAGLERLGLHDRPFSFLEPHMLLPAPGQGILAIEARENDKRIVKLAANIDHPSTHAAAIAERAFVRQLESGCRLPVGALATVEGETLQLEGAVAALDGSRIIRDAIDGLAEDAESLGQQLASRLLTQGADKLVEVAERAI
jgi:hydroxymethylbilane synthase